HHLLTKLSTTAPPAAAADKVRLPPARARLAPEPVHDVAHGRHLRVGQLHLCLEALDHLSAPFGACAPAALAAGLGNLGLRTGAERIGGDTQGALARVRYDHHVGRHAGNQLAALVVGLDDDGVGNDSV